MSIFEPIERIEIKGDKKPFINIALDTINKGKQALIFVNSKKRAEKTAEEIANALKTDEKEREEYERIATKALGALSTPTKQCMRLAQCLKKGVAFHHSGLVEKQRSLIENAFREGKIKIICATPTLAAGVDLPAFRVIIRDLTRFSHRGMDYIPVLEYLQQIGRAGRPRYDKYGEAIVICSTQKEKDYVVENYIFGEPEDIYSKLAVEPVLRTYVLSLIVTRFATAFNELMEFFSKTFWAHQFQDFDRIELIIERIIKELKEWGFIVEKEENDKTIFISANALIEKREREFKPTPIGKKVCETYVDPYTANHLIKGLKKAYEKRGFSSLGFLHLVSHTLEMRPLLNVKTSEEEEIEEFYAKNEDILLETPPSYYDIEYDDFLRGLKTAKALYDWLNEKSEEYLYEKYNMLPGEQKGKIEIADWLLSSLAEFSRVLKMKEFINEINKLRLRLKYGVKDELLPLVKLPQIGRVRARILFNHGFKNMKRLKEASVQELAKLVGKSIAIKIKKELTGEEPKWEEHSKEEGVKEAINENKQNKRNKDNLDNSEENKEKTRQETISRFLSKGE